MSKFLKTINLALFHLVVLVIPLFFRFNTTELFEFNKLMLTYSFVVLIMVIWGMRMILEQRLIIKRTIFDLPIAIFLMSQILSTIFSIHPHTSWFGYYTRFHGGLLSSFAYISFYYALVSTIEKRHLKPLLMTAILSACLVSIYAIMEHFGYSISCLLIGGASEFNTQCWVQDVQTRVFASFGQPNWLAAYLITLWPMTLGLALLTGKFTKNKAVIVLISILLIMALLYTKSRSGILGLGTAIAIMSGGIFWLLNIHKSYFEKEAKYWLSTILAIILTLGLIIGTPYTPSLQSFLDRYDINSTQEFLEPLSEEGDVNTNVNINRLDIGGTDSGEIRKIVWQGALKIWQRYPIFGSGVETFAYSYYLDRPVEHNLVSEWDFLYNKAHNEFLNYLATTGLVGLGSYILLLGWFFWRCYSFFLKKIPINTSLTADQIKKLIDEKLIILSASSGIIALSVSNFFGFSTVMTGILLYLFLGIVAVITNDQKIDLTPKIDQNKLGLLDYFWLVMLVLALVISWNKLYRIWNADIYYSAGKTLIRSNDWQTGVRYLENAIHLSPQEAVFYEELGLIYAQIAVALSQSLDNESALELAENAVAMNDVALTLNPAHLNFYRSRFQIMYALSKIDDNYLEQAKTTLLEASLKAPTDAKLYYYLGLTNLSLGAQEEGLQILEKTIQIKPNYEQARFELGNAYLLLGEVELAIEQYRYILDHISPNNQPVIDKLAELELMEG